MGNLSRRSLLFASGALALAGVACSNDDSKKIPDESIPKNESTETAETTETTSSELETFTKGKLTIATGEPAYSPWVEDNDPASGKGFEAAVAYAVAEKMGFKKEDVVWVRSTFDSAIAPGAKDWDFNLQQFSITDERRKAVDFSSSYYTTTQAVVTLEKNATAKATSLADLKSVLFGLQSGTVGVKVVKDSVKPEKEPLIFNNSQDTVQALKGGQVDAIVVDLPTALYLAAVELKGGKVVGQFPDAGGGENFGLVLPKDSKLTPAVTTAVDALREDGTLEKLQKEWLSDSISVPVLK
ncbi:MAG: amino acid ABC transporter substrate-binding protein [Propionibacterium sp.]|nr:MAG: amino acid ABC transporter substrate-binding protein [Propionibacterium sp.]